MNLKKELTLDDGRQVYSSPIDNECVSFNGRNFKLRLTDEELLELYFELKDIKCGLK